MFYRLFLPESPEVQYHFRPRSHDKLLIPKTADLSERDFIIRLLYKDCYWHFYIVSFYRFIFLHCLSCVCQLFIKDHDDEGKYCSYLIRSATHQLFRWIVPYRRDRDYPPDVVTGDLRSRLVADLEQGTRPEEAQRVREDGQRQHLLSVGRRYLRLDVCILPNINITNTLYVMHVTVVIVICCELCKGSIRLDWIIWWHKCRQENFKFRFFFVFSMFKRLPSVIWHCWLDIRPVKSWVLVGWW